MLSKSINEDDFVYEIYSDIENYSDEKLANICVDRAILTPHNKEKNTLMIIV